MGILKILNKKMSKEIITFECYIAFLLDTIVINYNKKYYPHMDKFELSNQFYLMIYNSYEDNEINLIELFNFIEFLKNFNDENDIKNQTLFNDLLLYLEFMGILMNHSKVGFKIFQKDIIVLNYNIVFKDITFLKYLDECKLFYSKEV
jgi:hypothetical protein